jgi:Photosynthetic reaction centre cytochrome C subunit
MQINKKFKVMVALTIAGIISAASVKPGSSKNDYTNLQVLPKDIAPKDLQRIMVDEFEDGLGVGCNFCHAQEKGSLHLDYASDAKPEKEIARAMMRMTMDINKKYFAVEQPLIGDSLMTISCSNCHHGTAHPGLNE